MTAIRDDRDYAQHCDKEKYNDFTTAMLRQADA